MRDGNLVEVSTDGRVEYSDELEGISLAAQEIILQKYSCLITPPKEDADEW